MQIYDDLIYGAAELLQDRATFLSFLLRNSFHLPSRILRCSEREEKKKKKETIETLLLSTIAFLLLAERGRYK